MAYSVCTSLFCGCPQWCPRVSAARADACLVGRFALSSSTSDRLRRMVGQVKAAPCDDCRHSRQCAASGAVCLAFRKFVSTGAWRPQPRRPDIRLTRRMQLDELAAEARDRVRAERRSYYVRNRDRILEYQRRRRAVPALRERSLEAVRRWRKSDPGHARAIAKAWREAHRDQINARRRAWRESHRDQVNARSRARYAANRDRKFEARRRPHVAVQLDLHLG
jgi:hypothetical protein